MNCHLVPCVYLRSWKIMGFDNSIYLFDKNFTENNGVQSNIKKLSETDFVAEDKYLLKMENHYYVYQLKPEYLMLFDSLVDYQISFNGLEILNVDDFIVNYAEILNWIIKDKNGDIVSPTNIRNSLEKLWYEKVEKLVESYFSQRLENYWNPFLTFISDKVLMREWMVYAKNKQYFLEFLAVQFCRKYENLKELGVDIAVGAVADFFDESVSFDEFKEDLCLIQLYKFVKHSLDEGSDYNNNVITNLIERFNSEMQISFLIAPIDIDFITTDSPCIRLEINSDVDNRFTGIYMPINKRVCAYLCKNNGGARLNKYLIMDVSSDNVKFINYMLVKKSHSKVAYEKDTLSGLISDFADIVSWVNMLYEAGLEYIDV